MEKIITLILIVVAAILTYRNIQIFKRMKKIKAYTPLSNTIFENEAEAYEKIGEYIKNESDPEFVNKANILRSVVALSLNKDCSEELTAFSIEQLVLKNGKFNRKQADLNSDSFFWLMVSIINGRNDEKILKTIEDKVEKAEIIKPYIYYDLALNLIDVFRDSENANFELFNAILEGNYSQYKYDKHLIILFKRIWTVVLAYHHQPLSEFDNEDLVKFASTNVGKYIMKNLGILDKYLTKN